MQGKSFPQLPRLLQRIRLCNIEYSPYGISKAMKRLARLIDHAKFLYVQRVSGFSVQTSPLLGSEEATSWFCEQLHQCRYYFEFGSGGSTYRAALEDKKLVSIDCDPFFMDAVKATIAGNNLYRPERQKFIYRDVGPITWWGTPIFNSRPGDNRAKKFRLYSEPPLVEFDNDLPDLILVDGRFRVACALKTMKALAHTSRWTLVVDDYVGRSHYHTLEQFGYLRACIGRLGIFAGVRAAKEDIEKGIAMFELDCR